jgi:hypothetical protein
MQPAATAGNAPANAARLVRAHRRAWSASWHTEIGLTLAVFTGPATFLAAWAYCTLAYGFLFGFGLGWLPAFFLALLVGGATVILWGPAVVLLLLFAVANLLG